MKLLSLIFILFCFGCSQFKKENNRKNNIDYDLVDLISIKKEPYATDSIYFLTRKEIQLIINEWNNSEYEGVYKMIPEYWIRINLKNDSIRTFRVNGKLIKETSDWTYSFSNSKFVSSLWKNAGIIPPPPKPPIIIECDSINKKAEIDYKNGIREYDILGTVEMTKFEQFYWKYMTEKYQIKIKANDQPSIQEECYAELMNSKIEEEYGKGFIDKTIEEARIEFSKLK